MLFFCLFVFLLISKRKSFYKFHISIYHQSKLQQVSLHYSSTVGSNETKIISVLSKITDLKSDTEIESMRVRNQCTEPILNKMKHFQTKH